MREAGIEAKRCGEKGLSARAVRTVTEVSACVVWGKPGLMRGVGLLEEI